MQSSYKNIQQPCAIIIGLDSLQGLQTARALAKRKVPVIAIAKYPKYHSCRTNVCKEIIFTNTEDEELIETLVELGPRLRQKAVIFPCQDMNVLLVSRNRHKLSEWYHIVLPSPDVIEILMNKASFYAYAQKEGLPIPRTYILKTRVNAEKAAQDLTYPAILKPSIRNSGWLNHTSLKAFKVTNAEELLGQYDRYHMWADVMIAQEWIEGRDTNHYTCHCYFNANSKPIVTFTSRKLRQWPPETGQRCLGEEYRNDIVMNETVRFFQNIDYYGLAYLEMKYDERSGKYLIVEPNVGRPTGSSTTAEAGGVELLYTMYCDTIGKPIPENIEQKYVGVKWIHLLRDIQASLYYWREGNLTFKEWLRSLQGRKAYALFSWSDPAPFLAALIRSISTMLSEQSSHNESIKPFHR
jgi:predicted ATP-grasp superfamily ATP-dependent carboligase